MFSPISSFRNNGALGPANERTCGFTLIELMIVVAIVAIIAAIAYPSYRQSVIKSDRSDAMVGLQSSAQAMERCYAQHHDYTDSECIFDAPNASTISSPNGFYDIAASTLTPTTYVLAATVPTGSPQADDDECTSFSLASNGAQTATGSNSSNCWQ